MSDPWAAFVYGPGAAESGQAPTPEQQAYARAMATQVDHGSPVGTPQNPAYDTPTAKGNNTIYHVTPEGRLYDPAASAATITGVKPAATGDEWAEFTPGQTFDTRPTSQSVGSGEGATVVGKNLADALTFKLPGIGATPAAGPLYLPQLGTSILEKLARGSLNEAEKTFRPGLKGKYATELALTAPLAAAGEGAPLLMGAVQGDLTSEATDPAGRLRDMAVGAVGGKAGAMVGGGVKSALWPTIRPEAQWALDNNIRLTPGAIAGGMMNGVESGAAKGTIAGPMVSNAQRQMITDANLSAVNNALKPAGLALPADIPAGTAAVDKAHDLFGKAYDKIVPNLTVTRDPEMDAKLAALSQYGADLDPALATRFQKLTDRVTSGFDQNGQMPGADMRKLDIHLGQQQRRFAQSQDPFHQEYADAISELQDTLRDATERTNPAYADQLGALNSGYAQLVRLDKAALLARQNGGVWTPDQLMQAVTTRGLDNSARQTSSARGRALLQGWAQSAKDVLPNKMPDAGNFWTHLPELLVTAGVGHESGVKAIGGLLAGEGALAGAYTPPMQSLIRGAMTQRPAVAKPVSDIVARLAPYMGQGGAMLANKAVWPALQPYVAAAAP